MISAKSGSKWFVCHLFIFIHPSTHGREYVIGFNLDNGCDSSGLIFYLIFHIYFITTTGIKKVQSIKYDNKNEIKELRARYNLTQDDWRMR